MQLSPPSQLVTPKSAYVYRVRRTFFVYCRNQRTKAMALLCIKNLPKRVQKLHFNQDLHCKWRCLSHQSGFSPESSGFLKKKLNQLVQWYEETTGMDEVRMAQGRVLQAEERFIKAQDRRREANKDVAAIQSKLKELYAELDNTTRGEDRYVTLITEEHKLLKQERQVRDAFQFLEREEREHFSALSSAVKESHEKERAQAERTKYWSIIGSVIGTIIGVVGSSVNNEIKMKELRKLVKESLSVHTHSDNSTRVPEVLSKHEKQLSVIVNEMKNVANLQNDHVIDRIDELIGTIDKVNIENKPLGTSHILDALRKQHVTFERNFDEIKTLISSQALRHRYQNSEHDIINDENDNKKIILLGSIIVLIPIVMKCLGITWNI